MSQSYGPWSPAPASDGTPAGGREASTSVVLAIISKS